MDADNPVFRSLDIIESNINEKLTVDYIAKSVNISKYHYQRMFREIMGNSVMSYVTKRKLTLAGMELNKTDAKVIDVALRYGYDSHEGFSRSFKTHMGVTPTDYRKSNICGSDIKMPKGRRNMDYSRITGEMIGHVNDFIRQAKETARSARNAVLPHYAPFWELIAASTDGYADKAEKMMERINSIAERPDEISGCYSIIKIMEEIAFHSNLLAFNAGLMVSRDLPENTKKQWPICEKYIELARSSVYVTDKTASFFREFTALVFDEMRRNAADMIKNAINKGNDAVSGIDGYLYIRDEIGHLVNEISSVPVEDITVSFLKDCLFRIDIISFAASVDIVRSPKDEAMFKGVASFKESLAEAANYFGTLIKPEKEKVAERTSKQCLLDIAYQGNILLFYTRGEVSHEKLGHLLDDGQKARFEGICRKINDLIISMHNPTEDLTYAKIAGSLNEVKADMCAAADDLKEKGGAVRFIANEFGALAERVKSL